jgi:hypothetical protein
MGYWLTTLPTPASGSSRVFTFASGKVLVGSSLGFSKVAKSWVNEALVHESVDKSGVRM